MHINTCVLKINIYTVIIINNDNLTQQVAHESMLTPSLEKLMAVASRVPPITNEHYVLKRPAAENRDLVSDDEEPYVMKRPEAANTDHATDDEEPHVMKRPAAAHADSDSGHEEPTDFYQAKKPKQLEHSKKPEGWPPEVAWKAETAKA